jgi:hypothetical protein
LLEKEEKIPATTKILKRRNNKNKKEEQEYQVLFLV